MVPEALAAQKIAPDRKEAAQDAPLVPLGHGCLAGWSKAAVDGGKSHVGADTDALVSFPSVAIDGGDQIQFLCQVIQGGGGREVRQDDLLGLWDLRRGPHSCSDVFGLAEVFLPNDLWLAVDTLAFAGIPVGTSPDHLLVQADGHGLGHTRSTSLCQDVVHIRVYSHISGPDGFARTAEKLHLVRSYDSQRLILARRTETKSRKARQLRVSASTRWDGRNAPPANSVNSG